MPLTSRAMGSRMPLILAQARPKWARIVFAKRTRRRGEAPHARRRGDDDETTTTRRRDDDDDKKNQPFFLNFFFI